MTIVARRVLWVGGVIAVVVVVVAVGVLLFVPAMLYPPLSDDSLRHVAGADTRIQLQQAQGQLQNDARSTLLQAIAGLLLTVGGAATWHQVQINKDAQLTDRFSRAIEHLGHDNVDIRIGGLYELERIAKNSVADRRMRAPDIQTALAILARRPAARDAPRLYLSRVDLRSVQLENNQLTYTHIRHANLARAWLRGTRLDGCDFHATDLRKANLEGASLRNASLRSAYLAGANLRDADLRDADLRDADLRGADLRADHLDSVTWTGAYADATTLWPDNFPSEIRLGHGIVDREPPS